MNKTKEKIIKKTENKNPKVEAKKTSTLKKRKK